jgi:hypothetical protein
MRARLPLGLLIAHHAVQNIGAGFKTKNRVWKVNRACVSGIECCNLRFHQACPSLPADAPAAAATPDFTAARKEPGFGAFSGMPILTASRT